MSFITRSNLTSLGHHRRACRMGPSEIQQGLHPVHPTLAHFSEPFMRSKKSLTRAQQLRNNYLFKRRSGSSR